jgi:hypothetical protein
MTDALDQLLTDKGALPPVTATPSPAAPGPLAPVPAPPGEKPSGEALINLVDALTPTVCRMWARRYKVKWTRSLEAAARLTADERKTLELVADSAACFIPALLAHSPKVAACIFLYLWYTMLKDRMAEIELQAPEPGHKKPEEGVAAGEDLEKRRKNHEPTGLPRGRPPKAKP